MIDAFNKDLPFDRFVREQVAGDLIEAKSPEERNRLKIATGDRFTAKEFRSSVTNTTAVGASE